MTDEPGAVLRCTTCAEPKTAADFYHRTNGARFHQCKTCVAARTRRYHQSEAGKAVLRDSQRRRRLKGRGADLDAVPKKRATAHQTVLIRGAASQSPRLFFSPFAWEQLGRPDAVALRRDGPARVSIQPGASFRVTVPPQGQPRITLGVSTLRTLGLETTRYPALLERGCLVITTPEVHVAFEVFVRTSGRGTHRDTVPILAIRGARAMLVLNHAASLTLGSPGQVELLWDKEQRAIGVRAAPTQSATTYRVNRSARERHQGGSVQLRLFARAYGLDLVKLNGRYDAIWADPILYIVLP